MEIYTPAPTPAPKAGHKPDYLTGLIDVIYLDKHEKPGHPTGANMQTMPDSGCILTYLDYVYPEEKAKSDVEPNPINTAWGNDDVKVDVPYPEISIKSFTKHVVPKIVNVNLKDTTDFTEVAVQKKISEEVLNNILELSKIHKQDTELHFPVGLDLVLTGDDVKSDRRRIAARILAAGNMIACNGRRGPSNFIIIGKKYMDYLRPEINDDDILVSLGSSNTFYGMKVFVSGKLDSTVVVGRCATKEEPGLHLITTTDDISGDIMMADMDIESVDVKYALTTSGMHPEKFYIQFDITEDGSTKEI